MMNRISFVISFCLFFLLISPQSFAQKGKRTSVDVGISSEVRKESATFADGLRAFYSNNYEEAESIFRSIVEKNGKNSTALFMLGKISVEKSAFPNAIYFFQEALSLDKKNVWIMVDLANTYNKMGDLKNAVKYWELICSEKKDNEYYLMELANCYTELNEIPKAIEVVDKLSHILGDLDYITETKVQLWLYINKTENAVNEYDKLIVKYPYNIDNYISAAKILISNSLSVDERALTYLKRAEKIDSNHPQLNVMLANYYEQIGDTESYYTYILKAFDNGDMRYETKIGIVEQFAQNAIRKKDKVELDKAIHLTELLVEKHPGEMYAVLTLANLQIAKEDYQNAVANFEKVVDYYPNSAALWEKFLIALNKTDNYQAIVKYADKITVLFPTHSAILLSIGKAYNRVKDGKNALNYLSQAVTYAFDNATISEVYYEMGNANFLLGNKEEALKNWKIAQNKGNNSEELKQKISELEK